MTAYADRDHLAKFGLPAAALEDVPVEDQDAALEAASRLADSHLRSRYTLPLISHGDDLRRVVCHIAAYDIMVTQGFNPEGPDANLRLRYEDAEKWLRAVATGAVTPEIVDSRPTGTAPRVFVKSRPLRGW